MNDASVVVSTLRSLGLTRAEAETYLALVLEEGSEPVSAYHVAQVMGKDPANLSKTLIALERVGAVRAIQEKPRLYVPIYPQQFTESLLVSMKEQSRRVMDQFQELQPALPRGVPMALGSLQQALEKSAELLTHCRGELLIFADVPLLNRLGTSLEALAASSEVAVHLISLESFEMPGVQNRVLAGETTFGTNDPDPWLQLVIDRSTWLTASFPSAGAGNGPVGWWCTDPVVAAVMGASLAAVFQGAALETTQHTLPVVEEKPELTFEEGLPVTEISGETNTDAEEPRPVNLEEEKPPAEEPEAPAPPPEEEADHPGEEDEEEDGITFLIQHDEDEDRTL